MSRDTMLLIGTAISISFLHTLAGPDHYLPFVALSKAKRWSIAKTIFWTVVCGCGHVWTSVLLGLGGAALGWSLAKVSWLESLRGGLAGWMLLGFGLVYAVWGLIRARQNRSHKHFDQQPDGTLYVFEHRHNEVVAPAERHKVTPWVMFLVFLLGPCEPMIPLLSVPAATASWKSMALLIVVYTLFTLLTMVLMVGVGIYGASFFRTEKLERYMHALGGMTIFACGAGMVFLQW